MITADRATDLAREYLRPFARFDPLSAQEQKGYWLVKVDVGIFEPKVIELEISTITGEILRAR